MLKTHRGGVLHQLSVANTFSRAGGHRHMIMGNCPTFACSQNSEFSDLRVLHWALFPKLIPKITPQGKGRERNNEHDWDISGLDGAYR